MDIKGVIEKLDKAHKLCRANEQISDKDFWRNLWINKTRDSVLKSKKNFLILTGKQLEAAQKLIKLYPFLKEQSEMGYAFLKLPDQNNDVRVKAAHCAMSLNILEGAISDMFFEPIVSRYGLLPDVWLHNVILEKEIAYSLQGAKEFADWLYTGKHGWSLLRTMMYQFGNYDEVRVFSDIGQ